MIKKLILVVSALVALALPLAMTLPAKAVCDSSPNDPLSCVCSQPEAKDSTACAGRTDPGIDPISGPNGIIPKVVNIVTIIVGVASVIVVILGGLQYVMSTGDSAKTAKAKDTIMYAAIGLAIAIMAQVIVKLVVNKL